MATLSKNSYGKLYIKKRSFHEWLGFFIIVLPFAIGFLTEVLRIPDFIRFSLDLVLAYFFVVFVMNRYMVVQRTVRPLLILVAIFFAYTLIVYLFNFQSPFYYIWGLRNNFRFYVAFFSFVSFLNEDSAIDLLKLLDILFWINFAVTLVQFFFMDVKQDYLGGLFGTTGGTNGYTLLFLCIIISKSLLSTFNENENPWICVMKCFASLLIAAMAEMKFYYFIFILLLAITTVLTGFSKRKLVILIAAGFGVVIGASLLTFWFDRFDNFLSLESIWESATKENYSSNNDLNRLSAIYVLTRDHVTNTVQQLFGMGLGNCDVSDLSIFNSSFYQNNSYLHYTWFSSAMLFLETGFVGLALYILFFVLCFRHAFLQIKSNIGNKLFCQMAIVMSVICVIMIFYNSSLRIEAGYMAYFILALPFIRQSREVN